MALTQFGKFQHLPYSFSMFNQPSVKSRGINWGDSISHIAQHVSLEIFPAAVALNLRF